MLNYEAIQKAAAFLLAKTQLRPRIGVILGTGLGGFAEALELETAIDYGDIPHFPTSTVQSHRGQLLFGTLQGVPVVVMAGRFHYYEGYSMQQVVFPVRVLKLLGVDTLLISNAAGGVHADYLAGDLVVVRDHINLLPENPLRGFNDERLGPRFPDMLHTYDAKLRQLALGSAQQHGFRAHEGVYLALQGPNLETPAEYEMVHRMGGTLVGMSTVPEVLAARHAGMQVLVVSLVSNKCYPLEAIRETSVDDVIAVAEAAKPRLRQLFTDVIVSYEL
jgi:purine-nucleoside phosphorylase